MLFACVKRLGLAFKFGFKFPVGGSVLIIFISLVSLAHTVTIYKREDTSQPINLLYIQLILDFTCCPFLACSFLTIIE